MVAFNRNGYLAHTASNRNLPVGVLAERVRGYFERHPDVAPERFLVAAVGRELRRRESLEAGPRSAGRRPLTAEDIRIHVWLTERLAALHRERHGFGPRLRRFFLGNRLVRWLISGR